MEDFHPDAIQQARNDCSRFEEMAEPWIMGEYERAASDFWLTRNGHGAGFWDGGWPEPHGTELTNISKQFPTCHGYIGDDGKIHLFCG